MSEIWKPVVGHEGRYEVSDRGRVRSVPRRIWTKASWRRPAHWRAYKGKILRPGRYCSSRHVSVVLGHGAAGSPVHQLVLRAFVGPRPKGKESLHINGKATDNRLSNLRYGTRSENLRDLWRHGTRASTWLG